MQYSIFNIIISLFIIGGRGRDRVVCQRERRQRGRDRGKDTEGNRQRGTDRGEQTERRD